MLLEKSFYSYGLRLGLPYAALNTTANGIQKTIHSSDLRKRRKLAQKLIDGSPWAEFLPRETGLATFERGEFPGVDEAIQAARLIVADRRKTGWKSRVNNPFYELTRPEDFRDHKELIDLALSDAVLQMVTGYLGVLPQLEEIGLWLTPPHNVLFGSQLYHLDKPEAGYVKMFINIEDNPPETGTAMALPIGVSNKVRRFARYDRHYYCSNGYLNDEAVGKHSTIDDQVKPGGNAGTGYVVDTSNCFHYGGRCASGERQLLVLTYMIAHRAPKKGRTPMFDLVPKPSEEIHQLVLSGAKFN